MTTSAHPKLFDELAVGLRGNVQSMNDLSLQGISVGHAPTNTRDVPFSWKKINNKIKMILWRTSHFVKFLSTTRYRGDVRIERNGVLVCHS